MDHEEARWGWIGGDGGVMMLVCVCVGGVYKLTAFVMHVLFLGREGERESECVLGWALKRSMSHWLGFTTRMVHATAVSFLRTRLWSDTKIGCLPPPSLPYLTALHAEGSSCMCAGGRRLEARCLLSTTESREADPDMSPGSDGRDRCIQSRLRAVSTLFGRLLSCTHQPSCKV